MAVYSKSIFEEMLQRADQLTAEETHALAEYLRAQAQTRKLTSQEFEFLWNSIVITSVVHGDISNRRVDWYDDDGR